MFLKDFNLIVAIVARGHSDKVMQSAKKAGAEGATIITARGNSIHETDTVLGVSIQPEKEVVLLLVKKTIRKKVMREVCRSSGISEEGQGVCFSLPVDEVGGISHLLGKKPTLVRKPTLTKKIEANTTKKEEKTVQKEEKTPKSQDKNLADDKKQEGKEDKNNKKIA